MQKYDEVRQAYPLEPHIIVCVGGMRPGMLEPVAETLQKTISQLAIEKKVALDPKNLCMEPNAVVEFYTFCNLRLLLTRAGVGRCILVAKDVDIERLLFLWTNVMGGMKIAISTQRVPTDGGGSMDRKRVAARLFTDAQEDIRKNTITN